jgi:fatty acid desaturase
MDHKTFVKALPTEAKATLTTRSDKAGIRHLALHAGVIVFFGALIVIKVPFWLLLMIPQGILIAFLFTLAHEATHKTPFASERLNEWAGWGSGVRLFQPFLWFRCFHLMHHSYTNIPEHDPELTGLPKPNDWPDFLWQVSSIQYWQGKVGVLATNAFGPITAPYIPERSHARLRSEARRMLAIYAGALAFTLFINPALIWAWLIPLTIGFPVLRIYLLAEHGRCPTVANMFDNTRTTYTNAIVSFLAWNMPYHVEHHVFPQVPFYLLPEFHRHIQDHLQVTSNGYSVFTRDYIREFEDHTF